MYTLGWVMLGSSMSLRSYIRVGSSMSLLGEVHVGISASVLDFVMLGSFMSIVSWLAENRQWRSVLDFAMCSDAGFLLNWVRECDDWRSSQHHDLQLVCQLDLYPERFQTRKFYHHVGESSVRDQPYDSRLWLSQ